MKTMTMTTSIRNAASNNNNSKETKNDNNNDHRQQAINQYNNMITAMKTKSQRTYITN
jgi:hypothetical protein